MKTNHDHAAAFRGKYCLQENKSIKLRILGHGLLFWSINALCYVVYHWSLQQFANDWAYIFGVGDEMATPVVKQLYFSNVMWFAFENYLPCQQVGADKAEWQHSLLVLSSYHLHLWNRKYFLSKYFLHCFNWEGSLILTGKLTKKAGLKDEM